MGVGLSPAMERARDGVLFSSRSSGSGCGVAVTVTMTVAVAVVAVVVVLVVVAVGRSGGGGACDGTWGVLKGYGTGIEQTQLLGACRRPAAG